MLTILVLFIDFKICFDAHLSLAYEDLGRKQLSVLIIVTSSLQSSMVLVIVTLPHCTNNKLAPVISGSCYCDVATLYKQQVGSSRL